MGFSHRTTSTWSIIQYRPLREDCCKCRPKPCLGSLRNLLTSSNRIYCDSGNLPKPYLNSTSSFEETRIADNYAVTIIQVSPDVPNRAYQGPYYRFEVGTPSSMYIKHDGSFGFGLERLMISWNVGVRPDFSGNDRWISMDHGSTLSDGSIPSSGLAFVEILVNELRTHWTGICRNVDQYLMDCVSQTTPCYLTTRSKNADQSDLV